MKRRIAVLFLCFAFVSGMAQAAVPPVWIHAGHFAGHHVAHVILPKIVSLKGVTGAPLAGVIIVRAAFAACVIAAVWHIPAWGKAKANGTEAQYQAQQMWPQQLFAKLPHGNYAYVDPKATTPSGGHLRASLLAMQN